MNTMTFILGGLLIIGLLILIVGIYRQFNSVIITAILTFVVLSVLKKLTENSIISILIKFLTILFVLSPLIAIGLGVSILVYWQYKKIQNKESFEIVQEEREYERLQRNEPNRMLKQEKILKDQSERIAAQNEWKIFENKYLRNKILPNEKDVFLNKKVNNYQLKEIYVSFIENSGYKFSESKFIEEYIDKLLKTIDNLEEKVQTTVTIFRAKSIGENDCMDSLKKDITLYKIKLNKIRSNYISFVYGQKGEEKVEHALRKLKEIYNYHYFRNIGIACCNEQADIDFLAVSRAGIFIIEVKNISDTVNKQAKIHFMKDGRVERIYGNGTQARDTEILNQHNFHEKVVKNFLKENRCERVPIHSIIVIANDHIDIKNENDLLQVVRIDMLVRLMDSKVEKINQQMYLSLVDLIDLNKKEEKVRNVTVLNDEIVKKIIQLNDEF